MDALQLQQHADWLRDGSGKRIEVVGADLGGADLRRANLRGANLRGVDLRGANLRGARFRYADLSYADLSGVALSGADLGGADLSDADLIDADLSDADLSSANFCGANLDGVNLCGVNFCYAIGNMREIKSAQFDKWAVTWSADVLAIGCQQHAIEKWRHADSQWIAAMDQSASNWWSRYGELVLKLIDASPATGKVLEVEA
jgi:hypothetical protein